MRWAVESPGYRTRRCWGLTPLLTLLLAALFLPQGATAHEVEAQGFLAGLPSGSLTFPLAPGTVVTATIQVPLGNSNVFSLPIAFTSGTEAEIDPPIVQNGDLVNLELLLQVVSGGLVVDEIEPAKILEVLGTLSLPSGPLTDAPPAPVAASIVVGTPPNTITIAFLITPNTNVEDPVSDGSQVAVELGVTGGSVVALKIEDRADEDDDDDDDDEDDDDGDDEDDDD